ncbi:MAG: universal stress protein [Gammaproteobacteria bacterium]|nr:universal stress protein [Gammaproteobacteria bacterium]
MTIRTILTPVDGRRSDTPVLEAALVLARRFGAHIKALHIRAAAKDATPFMFDRLSSALRDSVYREAERGAREKAERVRTLFDEFCARNDVEVVSEPGRYERATAGWYEDEGHVGDVVVRWARLNDMVAFARPASVESTVRRSPIGENLEAVLLEGGRPVFVVPADGPVSPVDHVAIGWNASMEASRAVAMALPCLTAVESVTVLASHKRADSAAALIEHLAWHGITAHSRVLDLKGRSVGNALLNDAKEAGARLLIVGGFSRARARELLFGGVTRHLLANADLPVLMVH